MTIHAYWRLDPADEPARGEASLRRSNSLVRDVRPTTINRFDHYAQIARAAELTGFDGLFIADRPDADDSQIIAAAVARGAARLLLVPEFPASVGSAVYAAKRATSFQRATQGRLGWAIVPDGDAASRLRAADVIADADLLARTEEFLHVARGVHHEQPFDHKGRFFEVEAGGFTEPLNRVPFPAVFLRGEDEETLALSARTADVHLLEHGSVDALRDQIEALDRLALREDRTVEFGLVATVAAREFDEEAEAERGAADIVGTYQHVVDQLATLASIGITHFVLSASPSLEEAYRVGQFVLPGLRARFPALRAAA